MPSPLMSPAEATECPVRFAAAVPVMAQLLFVQNAQGVELACLAPITLANTHRIGRALLTHATLHSNVTV